MKESQTSPDVMEIDDTHVVHVARRVTWVGFWTNAILGVAKVLAGIFGRSAAMVADGVHSFSDFISDIIVLIFVGISRRKADERYQYGHGKYETFATMLLSLILLIVGVLFFIDGFEKTWQALHGTELPSPTYLALGMCVLSIGSKEWLFHYTRRAGERIGSAVVIANAWHHRSDALSSLATMVGIAGAMFLGPKLRILDPIAAMVVSVFIVVVAIQLGKPAIRELLEASLSKDVVREMYSIIGSTPGVEAFHRFASRQSGSTMFVDFHIKVQPRITVEHGHRIASDVERRLRDKFGPRLVATIHVEPYKGQPVDNYKMCK